MIKATCEEGKGYVRLSGSTAETIADIVTIVRETIATMGEYGEDTDIVIQALILLADTGELFNISKRKLARLRRKNAVIMERENHGT